MNYTKIYNEIVERAKTRILEGYKERHHIIPKCINGTDDKSNLVELTAREHFICHKLLTEIYPKENGLHYAVRMMVNMNNFNKYKVGSREYQRLKESVVVSEETCKKLSEAGKGRIFSAETREKIKKSNTGYTPSEESKEKNRLSHIGKTHSKETREKIGNGVRNPTAETRRKMSISQTGRTHSVETRKKMSIIQQNMSDEIKNNIKIGIKKQKKYKCSVCGIVAIAGTIKRWHNGKCKLK